jgi:hypothetical protein
MNAFRGTPHWHARVSGGGAMKLVIGGVVVIFLVFYMMTSPDQAANIVHSSWHTAVNVAHGVGNFVNKLSS